MAWTAPRTWVALETVTAALMNTHVRDNLLLLKTKVDDDGSLNTQMFGVGFSVGGANTSTTETDPLPGFTFSLPANFLDNGEFLHMRGFAAIVQNTNAKTIRFRCGGGTAITVWTSAASVAGHIALFDCWLDRRTSTTGAVQGVYYKDAAADAQPTPILINAAVASADFTIAQTTRLTGQGGATNDILAAEWLVSQFRGAGTIR
jgi:hypothetical protein